MKTYFTKLTSKLDGEILNVCNSESLTLKESEKCRSIVFEYYNQLSEFILNYEFKSEQEEIEYFKQLKPAIVSKLIFYCKASKMLKNIPLGGTKSKKKYINRETEKIERFYESNIELITYFRSEETFSDHIYFLRKNISPNIIPVSRLLDIDKNHTSNGSYTISRMLANIKLNEFLENELEKLTNQKKTPQKDKTPKSGFIWTAPKSALIEVIYGLILQGAINKGEVEIKQLTKAFESFFDIELGDPYRQFVSIKQRKKTTAIFLESLADSLIQHMNDNDQRNQI